jgi:diguanylate cyclase (GGDEF)-like protein/PAS domain S-box-containing protein
VVQARDAAGGLRLVGHAMLPLEAAGVGFAGRAALLIDLPYAALLAEADARRRDQALAAGALAALGVLLAWLLARRWVERPLKALMGEGVAGAGGASFEARALAALRPAGTWLRHQGDLAAVADVAGEMVLRLDAELRVTYASPATRALLGYAPTEVEGAELAREPGWEAVRAQIEALRQGEMAPPPSRLVARRRDDAEVALEVRARRLADGGFVLACRDVGVEMALQRELEEARVSLAAVALSDKLTGLPNRRRFDEALGQELGRARRAQEPISLVLLRLEDWPGCAAKLGAEQAETALQQIGRLLTGALRRPGDLAARLDEALFAVLLPTTDRIGAQRVAERLREAVSGAWRQLSYAGLAARIGAGSVLPLAEDDSAEGLVELAARALQEEQAAHGTALLVPRPAPVVALRPAEAVERETQAT